MNFNNIRRKNLAVVIFVLIATTIMGLSLASRFVFAAPLQKESVFQIKDVPIISLKGAKSLKVSVNTVTFEKPIVPLSIEDPIASGVSWLEQNQNSDGSWGTDNQTSIRDTEKSLEALYWLNYSSHDSFSSGIDWFRLSISTNNDYIARTVYALSLVSDDTTNYDDYLVGQINSNGGFGYQAGYDSDILTSALVLRALTASGYEDPGDNPNATVTAILNYLLTSTNADGAWGYRCGDASALYPTLVVLEALLPYKSFTLEGPGGDIIIATKIDLALSWVLSKQQADGGFGISSSNIALSALAYHTLLQYEVYPTDNEGAISYLLDSQETDGSWNAQDPYATASSLMALGRPDITVTDIQQLTDLLPNQTTFVRVTIKNIGYTSTQPIPASQFIFLVDGQETPLEGLPDTITFEPNSTLNLDIEIIGLPAGEHAIGFRVDYENTELRADNNSHEEIFTWTDPEFVGPPPPAWTGAITFYEPGKIYLTWLSSEGSDVADYWIYYGTAPNTYVGYIPLGGPFLGAVLTASIDVHFYFSVVAVNSSSERGDYSMETSAIARLEPDLYVGSLSGTVQGPLGVIPSAQITFQGFIDEFFTDAQGQFAISLYPGYYYVTASKDGYQSQSQAVAIPDNGNVILDFQLPVIDDGIPPPAITGVAANPGNGQVAISWNPLGDSVSDFYYYAIYRKTSSFTNVTGMTPITMLSGSHAGSYTDSSVVNGISYYYAITAVDLAGNEFKDVSSVGPAKPNSAPVFSSLNAYQRTDGIVQINYDVTDQENPTVSLSLEYDAGAGWQETKHSSGTGPQAIGTGKVALWEAKKDAEGLDQDIQIRLSASDGEAVYSTAQIESAPFHLDTLNPPLPFVEPVESPTSIRNQILKGTKESGAALLLNGKEIKALGTGADWDYEVSLSEGTNSFSFVAKDAFSNFSGTRGITIVLDTLPPDGSASVVEIQQVSPIELKLSWQAVTKDSIGNPETVQKYLIYRGTTANFEPTPENLIAEVTEATYTDSPATLGNVDVNSYYAIEVMDAVGHRAWLANRVGEYEFRLYTTAGATPGTDYTLISLPFELAGVRMASELAGYIQEHTDKDTSVITIYRWIAEAQSYSGYYPIPEPLGDFEISPGEAYQIEVWINGTDEVNDNTIVTFVGKVPSPRTFELKTTPGAGTDYNWVSLPLGHTDITMASQLKQYIEAHSSPITTVRTISYWNPIAQLYRTYDPVPDPTFGDFEVKDGQAYQVEVTEDSKWSP